MGSCSSDNASKASSERAGAQQLALAQGFAAGSLIIPMDTTYQDVGMLTAYGLVYQLTLKGIPVFWAIDPAKAAGGSDFTASATDVKTNAVIAGYAYRGGPFLVDAADAAQALPVVTAWQAKHTTTVHKASAGFSASIARKLIAAPKIGVFIDGNELIAFEYFNAAGIPDSLGQAWPKANANAYPGFPDILSDAAVAGPTTTNHGDGALVTAAGAPTYCHLTSMHYDVKGHSPEVVAETRNWLAKGAVHLFAECQAVNAFENDAASGHMLATNGFVTAAGPKNVSILVPASPFAQLDGAFKTVGGSEPAYDINGGMLRATDSLLVQATGAALGKSMVFLTGYLDGLSKNGKVSYLGGHSYTTATPISTNPTTQGTRLFLNGIVESPCASDEGQPTLTFSASAPASTSTSSLTFTLSYKNDGPGVALGAVVTDTLPPGTTFVSATGGGTLAGGTVTWTLGDLPSGASGNVTFTVTLASQGTYDNSGLLSYEVGNTPKTLTSNTTTTTFGCTADSDCAANQWCNTQSSSCVAKLPNGLSVPIVPGHTPALTGVCSASVGTAICASAVCDTKDNACGLADGDGPCTVANGATICRAGVCGAGNVCGPTPGCNADSDCSGGTWCNETSHTCTMKLTNGVALPSDPAHANPTLNGVCTAAAATLVCASGVCDTADNKCGFANGDGPCTSGNGSVVCRSSACSANGMCQPAGGCNIDADCNGGEWCKQSAHTCTPSLTNGTLLPTDPPHVNPVLNGTCTALAGALVCTSSVCDTADDKCGYANGDGPCTSGNGSVVCRSSVCSVGGTCQPAGGCNVDADCLGGDWCNESAHLCTAQLPNGTAVPSDPPHVAPALDGNCTVLAGALVCASGVCDVADDQCGYANGDGPCTATDGAAVCRSGLCNGSGVCTPALACNSDQDCDADSQFCNTASHLCAPKLPNGSRLLVVPGHTPTLDGICSAAEAMVICLSNVCDIEDNACGYANGDGPCTSMEGATVCRSRLCGDDGLCTPTLDCSTDQDCDAASQYCDTGVHFCVSKLPNEAPLPVVPGHTPPLDGVCSTVEAAVACISAVCDADDACGYENGTGPCTNANGAVVCRSGLCATSGPNQGQCVVCVTDASCAGATPVCDPDANDCVQCTPTNHDACNEATPVCDAKSSACVPCDGDLGSGTTAACSDVDAPYCFLGGSSLGECGQCSSDADCGGHPAGPACDTTSGTCGPRVCHSDVDCAEDAWCNAPPGGSGDCTPKLENGTPLPENPASVSTCTADVGERVCQAGVCDPKDNACGLADGDGPCSGDTSCRNGSCDVATDTCGVTTGCSKDSDCPTNEFCAAGGSCTHNLPDGEACDGANQCGSNACTRQVCGEPFVASGNGVACNVSAAGGSRGPAGLALLGWLLAVAGIARRRRRGLGAQRSPGTRETN